MRSAFEPLLDATSKVRKPFWLTEGSNMISRMGNGMYRHTQPCADDEDSIDTSDRLARGAGNARRALVTEERYPHPSAHSAMAWFLEDTKMRKIVSPAAGVTSYVFEGAGRTVTVLAPQGKHAGYALPSTGFDLFGNPLPNGSRLGKTLVYLTTP